MRLIDDRCARLILIGTNLVGSNSNNVRILWSNSGMENRPPGNSKCNNVCIECVCLCVCVCFRLGLIVSVYGWFVMCAQNSNVCGNIEKYIEG